MRGDHSVLKAILLGVWHIAASSLKKGSAGAADAQPKFFAAWLRPLFRKNWVVYSKPPFGGSEYVLQYLGRYTHRVAICILWRLCSPRRRSHLGLDSASAVRLQHR